MKVQNVNKLQSFFFLCKAKGITSFMHKKQLSFLLLLIKLPSSFEVVLTETENVLELKICGQLHGLLLSVYLKMLINEREFLLFEQIQSKRYNIS